MPDRDALDVIPMLPAIFGDSFVDTSAILSALAFKLARQHVTVALTGDGGDAIFGGYPPYW